LKKNAQQDSHKQANPTDSASGYDLTLRTALILGTTGSVAVLKQIDPDHYELLRKVPTGAIAKSGLWIPELKRYYSAVPKHLIQTAPYGPGDYITEESHLLVFDYVP
jgi:hypothetical protein